MVVLVVDIVGTTVPMGIDRCIGLGYELNVVLVVVVN